MVRFIRRASTVPPFTSDSPRALYAPLSSTIGAIVATFTSALPDGRRLPANKWPFCELSVVTVFPSATLCYHPPTPPIPRPISFCFVFFVSSLCLLPLLLSPPVSHLIVLASNTTRTIAAQAVVVLSVPRFV